MAKSKKTAINSYKMKYSYNPEPKQKEVIVIIFSNGTTSVVGCEHFDDRGLLPCCNHYKK